MTDLEKVELAMRRAAITVGGPAQYLALQFARNLSIIIQEEEKRKEKTANQIDPDLHELNQRRRSQDQ